MGSREGSFDFVGSDSDRFGEIAYARARSRVIEEKSNESNPNPYIRDRSR